MSYPAELAGRAHRAARRVRKPRRGSIGSTTFQRTSPNASIEKRRRTSSRAALPICSATSDA
jgi:hypothetical protein